MREGHLQSKRRLKCLTRALRVEPLARLIFPTMREHACSLFKVRRVGLLVILSIASAAGLITPALAANSTHRKLTPLQLGLAFYQGKTITFIAPTSAGSGSDIDTRAITQE